MKKTKILMDMPITIEIVDKNVNDDIFDKIFYYFQSIEDRFSFFKETSEVSLINNGLVKNSEYSEDMKEILSLSEKTKIETNGYFDIKNSDGKINPSGLVKGWAIFNASKIILKDGFKNFYIDAGGDIQTHGENSEGLAWSIGIRNPFGSESEIIKVLSLEDVGVATSGTYIRGQHVYDPHNRNKKLEDIVSITVVGPNVYEADRFATAAFAMGREGINFIERLDGFEGYMIDKNGIATITSGFDNYVKK